MLHSGLLNHVCFDRWEVPTCSSGFSHQRNALPSKELTKRIMNLQPWYFWWISIFASNRAICLFKGEHLQCRWHGCPNIDFNGFMYCICMLSSFAESIEIYCWSPWHPLASLYVSTMLTLRIGFFHLHQYLSWKYNVLWAWHPMPTTPWVGSWWRRVPGAGLEWLVKPGGPDEPVE